MMANSSATAHQDVAETPARTAAPRYGALEQRVRGLFTSHSIQPSDAGIQFVSLVSGDTLLDISSDRQMLPASTAKLTTTAAALHLLGKDFEYVTRLQAFGTIADGTLDGDLVVVGSGDPDISGRHHDKDPTTVFTKWASTLSDSGITRVTGDLIGDSSTFDSEFVHPNWPQAQLERWYCAPAAALSLNDNCLDVTVSPGAAVGDPVRVSLSPDTAYATIANRAATVSAMQDHLYGFVGLAGSRSTTLRGSFWINSAPTTTSIPVENPPLYFLTVLRETLEANGITVEGEIRVSYEPVVIDKPLAAEAVHQTPLDKVLAVTNKSSQNFYAEQLLKTLGSRKGEGGSFEQGSKVISNFLADISPAGLNVRIDDGSGLSRANRLSARALTDLLVWMVGQPEARTFISSLAIGGVDGTLSDRFTGDLSGRVFGKTGTLTGVSTLAGYIQLEDDYAAFTIFVTSRAVPVWRMRRFKDAVCRAVIEFSRESAAAKAE